MRKVLARLIAVAIALSAVLFVGATPSTAALSDCPSGYGCWWSNASYGGTYFGAFGANPGWPAGIVNNDESTRNNGTSGQVVHTYANGLYVNPAYCLNMGTVLILPTSMRNNGSSNNWTWSVPTCF